MEGNQEVPPADRSVSCTGVRWKTAGHFMTEADHKSVLMRGLARVSNEWVAFAALQDDRGEVTVVLKGTLRQVALREHGFEERPHMRRVLFRKDSAPTSDARLFHDVRLDGGRVVVRGIDENDAACAAVTWNEASPPPEIGLWHGGGDTFAGSGWHRSVSIASLSMVPWLVPTD